jgi:hypothetical protein
MYQRVVDCLREQIDRRRVYFEVEDAVVEPIVVCCDQSIDVRKGLWGQEHARRKRRIENDGVSVHPSV